MMAPEFWNKAAMSKMHKLSRLQRFSGGLLTVILLVGCSAAPVSQEAASTQEAASPSALVSAATEGSTVPAHSGVPAPHEATATAWVDAEGGPVPPIAPEQIGENVAVYPTAVFLPAIVNTAGGTVPNAGGTVPGGAANAGGETGDSPPPNLALVSTPAGPAFSWQETENYLILGTDRRAQEGSWRTDSIMVVGLDRANNRAAVFSIPRDTYVNIPGYGWGRINQADYMGERRETDGGPKLVGQIVEEILGIPTQHYVRIQMDGFIDFVDALGGVDIYLDCPFSEPIFNLTTQSWTRFVLPAGENHLDGEDAYWFARLRLEGSDIGRSSRQRAIIWAMRDQILSTNALLRLPELYAAFNDTITTDLGLFDIIGLAQTAISLDASNVRASGLTLRDLQNYVTDGGAQVLVIGNPERVRNIVESVWDAPAMANAFRGSVAGCPDPEPAPEDPPADAPAPEGEDANVGALPDVITDPVTGQLFDSATGFPIDPATGLPIDPATGEVVAPDQGGEE